MLSWLRGGTTPTGRQSMLVRRRSRARAFRSSLASAGLLRNAGRVRARGEDLRHRVVVRRRSCPARPSARPCLLRVPMARSAREISSGVSSELEKRRSADRGRGSSLVRRHSHVFAFFASPGSAGFWGGRTRGNGASGTARRGPETNGRYRGDRGSGEDSVCYWYVPVCPLIRDLFPSSPRHA